jgi:uncharacterized membrane protein YedE/YeeE
MPAYPATVTGPGALAGLRAAIVLRFGRRVKHGGSPMTSIDDIDVDPIEPDVMAEWLRQSEMRQDAPLAAAMGMDQRAAVIGAGLVAAAGALAAASLAASDTGTFSRLRLPALLVAMQLCVAAGLCIWACRPQKFNFPGIEPLDWGADPKYLEHPLRLLQASRLANLQKKITANEQKQAKNSRALSAGLWAAALSPAIGAIYVAAAATSPDLGVTSVVLVGGSIVGLISYLAWGCPYGAEGVRDGAYQARTPSARTVSLRITGRFGRVLPCCPRIIRL